MIHQPELVVRIAERLLESQKWEEVAVGLAVTTGRRLTEILNVGKLLPKTTYTVIFSGQLKRRDKVLNPYEIPTLVEAARVLMAWDRLREMKDCSLEENDAISVTLGPVVSAVAQHLFAKIVPAREGRGDLYTHMLRAVYGCLAVYYYCPSRIVDLAYLSMIYGHYWETEGKTEHDYNATMKYYDYVIGDGVDAIDRRQGIRLRERDVALLEVFQEQEEQPEQETKIVSTTKATKTGYSLMRPSQQTRSLFV